MRIRTRTSGILLLISSAFAGIGCVGGMPDGAREGLLETGRENAVDSRDPSKEAKSIEQLDPDTGVSTGFEERDEDPLEDWLELSEKELETLDSAIRAAGTSRESLAAEFEECRSLDADAMIACAARAQARIQPRIDAIEARLPKELAERLRSQSLSIPPSTLQIANPYRTDPDVRCTALMREWWSHVALGVDPGPVPCGTARVTLERDALQLICQFAQSSASFDKNRRSVIEAHASAFASIPAGARFARARARIPVATSSAETHGNLGYARALGGIGMQILTIPVEGQVLLESAREAEFFNITARVGATYAPATTRRDATLENWVELPPGPNTIRMNLQTFVRLVSTGLGSASGTVCVQGPIQFEAKWYGFER